VSVEEQLDIFDDDIRLVHAGQHLLASGKDQMKAWLNSVGLETSSHFVKNIDIYMLKPNVYEVTWQTPYQAIRSDGRVGGSIIRYQTLITFTPSCGARFTFIQKTPFENNPNTQFTPSFGEHSAGALRCRIQSLIDNDIFKLPAEMFLTQSSAQSVNRILATQGEKQCRLKKRGDDETPDILLMTTQGDYQLTLHQQQGWYPAIATATLIE
jgi:hypothetical protein